MSPCGIYPGLVYEHDDENKRKMAERLDKVTALLCEACDTLIGQEHHECLELMSDELREWWTEHQKMDAERRKHETDTGS